jgi:hypothetical protein
MKCLHRPFHRYSTHTPETKLHASSPDPTVDGYLSEIQWLTISSSVRSSYSLLDMGNPMVHNISNDLTTDVSPPKLWCFPSQTWKDFKCLKGLNPCSISASFSTLSLGYVLHDVVPPDLFYIRILEAF